MERNRVRIIIEVDLDPVPGFGSDGGSWQNYFKSHCEYSFPWYNPVVTTESVTTDNSPKGDTEDSFLDTGFSPSDEDMFGGNMDDMDEEIALQASDDLRSEREWMIDRVDV